VARLDAAPLAGTQAVTPEQLSQAQKIILDRIKAAEMGVAAADVSGDQIVVTLAGQHTAEEFATVVAPATLRFRKVLRSAPAGAPGQGVTIPGTPGSSAPSTTGTSMATAPTATAPTAGAPATAASVGPVGTRLPSLAEVTAKVGAKAMTLASTLAEPSGAALPQHTATLASFSQLTPAEVAVLPASVQYALPQITCATLNRRPLAAVGGTEVPVAACDTQATTRYLLDLAAVTGPDLAGADASFDTQIGTWKIDITFTSTGQARWTALTREAYQNNGGACLGVARCLVAITVDHRVISAPEIQGVITGPAQITGAFSQAEARLLASQLRFGALPVVLSVSSVDVQRPK
jgi:preprotein translocase subunit SecD